MAIWLDAQRFSPNIWPDLQYIILKLDSYRVKWKEISLGNTVSYVAFTSLGSINIFDIFDACKYIGKNQGPNCQYCLSSYYSIKYSRFPANMWAVNALN